MGEGAWKGTLHYPDSQDYYKGNHGPLGSVHVLQEHLLDGGGLLTACGLEAEQLLWNANGGPTNCTECSAAIVERALLEAKSL